MNDFGRPLIDHPLVARLGHYHDESEQLLPLFEAAAEGAEAFSRNAQIWLEMERPDHAMILEDGWAYHYKDLPGGERQICQFLLPGDILDGASLLPGGQTMTGVRAVDEIRVRRLDADRLADIMARNRELGRAMWWAVVQTDNVFREHITRVGRQSAAEALAHLLLELVVRSRMAGLADGNGTRLPLTQMHLADHLGLTPVHVSRTMNQLRRGGYLEFESRTLRILRWNDLCAFCAFDPTYLTVGCRSAD